jgi:hypothetical protein
MADLVLSCFVLDLECPLTVDICEMNKISDSYYVSINNLTVDHLKQLIWNIIKKWRDMENVKDYNELVLWKVEIPLKKLNKSLSRIEIEQLGGMEMGTISKFRKFFPVEYVPLDEIIHIIITTGKCLPMFYLSNKDSFAILFSI